MVPNVYQTIAKTRFSWLSCASIFDLSSSTVRVTSVEAQKYKSKMELVSYWQGQTMNWLGLKKRLYAKSSKEICLLDQVAYWSRPVPLPLLPAVRPESPICKTMPSAFAFTNWCANIKILKYFNINIRYCSIRDICYIRI